MKKITLLFFLMFAYLGYAQPTTNATDPPARDAADVISIFSGVYTDVTGTDFNPFWNQSGHGTANTAYDPGTGNIILAYPNFNYQGVQFGSTQNIAAMEFLHVDIWINGTFNPNVYVISSGAEIAHPITNTGAGSWISVDIPVPGITGNLSAAIQFKFDGGNGSTDGIYVDNLYFWKAPADPNTDATLSDLQVDSSTISGFSGAITDYTYEVPFGTTVVPQITLATPTQEGLGASAMITQASAIPGDATVVVTAANTVDTETYTISFVAVGPPTAAPTPPNRPAADVKSIFSDAYTDSQSIVSVDTFDTPWCPGTTTDASVDGNAVKKVSGLGCEGVEFITGRFDATSFTHFHMDIYTDTPTLDKSFNLKFSNWNNGGGEANAIEYSVTNGNFLTNPNPGIWISLDIPLADFTGVGNSDRNDLVQFIITSDLGIVYYDNLYLHKNTTLSTQEFELTDVSVYPNPSQDVWNVKTNNTVINTVQVFDVLGKQVMTLTPKSTEVKIDASTLNTGLYIAKIATPNGVSNIRLIKN